MSKASVVVIGAGVRGYGYANVIKDYFSDLGNVVAICEPDTHLRNKFGDDFDVPENKRFNSWEDIVDLPKMADAAFVCTQDAYHVKPAIAMAQKGYHLLLEKPMAPSAKDCKEISDAVKENNVMMAVCHVLRYTLFNKKLKELIDRGLIGKIRSIQLIEQVTYWHQAHSYVRGNWRNEALSSSMLLAKSCHDIDILNYLTPTKCTKVSSFGSLSYFTRENQPKGAADRCVNCPAEVETMCAYSALRIYLKEKRDALDNIESLEYWPVKVVCPIPTREAVLEALRTGPYGKCVFACDNDVVDHQVVNMEFEDGATASFTMCAFTPSGGREIYIMGDQGTLRCTEGDITHSNFLTNETNTIDFNSSDGMLTSGHGGGDSGLIKDFLTAVSENDPSYITSGPDVSLESHLIVFAAEQARLNNTVEKI